MPEQTAALEPKAELVARCGLYCGACGSYLKGRCPGCRENVKATWCKVRACCGEHSYASCADCTAQLGCGWCDSHGGQCVEASPDHSHPLAGACDYEEWSFAEEYCSTGG